MVMMMRYEGTKIYMRKSTPLGLDIFRKTTDLRESPRASGSLAKFIGFIGYLKIERFIPSNAFEKKHDFLSSRFSRF